LDKLEKRAKIKNEAKLKKMRAYMRKKERDLEMTLEMENHVRSPGAYQIELGNSQTYANTSLVLDSGRSRHKDSMTESTAVHREYF